ncbi:MAG: stage V sporulation protein AD [Ruminococcaceae bacterium]|nr:stage V sporulation protein AD [Oscillospiraceae bacterium]
MYIKFSNRPSVLSYYAVAGRKEKEGPIGHLIEEYSGDDRFSKDTWEKAESEMQRRAFSGALSKLSPGTVVDCIFAGDLMNQCTSSNYGLIDFDTPYIGLYGACSTCAESIALASMSVSAGYAVNAGAVTSSHFCSAERQFRFPLEYGGQRTPTSQRTVTASGAFIISNKQCRAEIAEVMFGTVRDGGIKDINNMGAAMAPAAIDTLCTFFDKSDTRPSDYDLIVTGDLGYEGYSIVKDLMAKRGRKLGENYSDCGLIVFDRENQDMHAGGSGCGCSALVLGAKILPEIEAGKLHEVLFIGTGALMSPTSLQQGLSIPAVAHLVHFSSKNKEEGK